MQELVESMVRFSTALVLFGVQQLQTAVELPADSEAAIRKMRERIEVLTGAIASQLDENKRPAIESMSNLAGKTISAFDVPALHPSKLMETATDVVKKAADAMGDALSKATQSSPCPPTDEPVQASSL